MYLKSPFFPHCSFDFLQVLLFLQKEKEESPPEAQVKEENRENLKHCGHCQVLNGSNYTDPLSFISSQLPSHLFSLSPYFHCHSVPPTSCSLSFSVLPGYWRVKGMLQSYWLHNRLLIPLSMKNKCTYITTGVLRKSKKAVTVKLEYRGVNMKKYCLKQLMYFRFHEDQLLDRENHSSGSTERHPLIRKHFFFFFFFFFLWCVFWDQGKEEKVNYADVKSERHRKHFIDKTEFGGFLCLFFFSSSFL